MKTDSGWYQQHCISIILTQAEARLLAAAIRTKQNGLATDVRELLLNWAKKA
jgi:hypothetical protein